MTKLGRGFPWTIPIGGTAPGGVVSRQPAGTEPLNFVWDYGDGALDIADAIKILGHLFADAGPLPAPFDTCAADPTADALDCSTFPPCAPP